MLTDLTPPDDTGLQRVGQGLYVLIDVMATYSLRDKGWMEFRHEWPEYRGNADHRMNAVREEFESDTLFSEYGSCDSPEQFLAHAGYGKKVVASPHSFIVTFHYMPKAEYAGYRWHKNGPYVGLRERMGHEYLEEEPNIEAIYQFHVLRQGARPKEA
jgi:hypothetical protein